MGRAKIVREDDAKRCTIEVGGDLGVRKQQVLGSNPSVGSSCDVLKTLYESLIDPRQRHDLGEYYTPDWLAERMCVRAIPDPLDQRVLDPACGSGTFPFHAVRRLLAAADAAGMANRDALARCCEQVMGIDVHPVAVIVARVTYLLALGEARLRDRPALAIPIYLGDALQWNTQSFMAEREVLIAVPDGPTLLFPFAVTREPARNLSSPVRQPGVQITEVAPPSSPAG